MLRARLGIVLVVGCAACSDDDARTPDSDAGTLDAAVVQTLDGALDARSSDAAADASVDAAVIEDLRYRNGSRLKRVVLRAPGTVDALTPEWFDTQLGIECSVATDSDGVPRCLPTNLSSGQLYLDATCTQLLFSGPAARCTGRPVSKYGAVINDCGRGAVYAVSPAGDLATRKIYVQDGAGCTEAAGDWVAGYRTDTKSDRYVSGAKVDNTLFTSFAGDARSDGVPSVRWRVAEDGARQSIAYYDAKGAWCDPTHGPNVDVCLPSSALPGNAYANNACIQQLLTHYESCPSVEVPAPTVSYDWGTQCAPEAHFYEATVFSQPVWTNQTDMCQPVPAGGTYYQRGKELARSSLLALNMRTEDGPRLHLRSSFDDKGRRIEGDWSHAGDLASFDQCFIGDSIAGKYYCTPRESAALYYRDAACTQPVLNTTGCNLAPGTRVSVNNEGACGEKTVWKLGAKLPDNTPVFRQGTTCDPYAAQGALWVGAAEVPTTELLELSRVY